MAEQYDDFGAFFRSEIMPGMIAGIEPALDHIRRSNPEEWLRIARKIQQQGPYDRLEQRQEAIAAFTALIEDIAKGLKDSLPEFVRRHNEAMEQHYVRHGLELDELMRKHPRTDPMSAKDSVDAQLRAMGINIRPDDQR